MNQKRQIWKNYLIRVTFIFAMLGFCFWNKGFYVQAETTEDATVKATPVKVEYIDYEKGTIQIATNHNTKVFYSDSTQKTWNVIEGAKENDVLTMDISWISAAKDYELNLKGSDDETIVTVELPQYNSKVKAVFDKVEGSLEFLNEDGATEFEWRKAAATDNWNPCPMDLSDKDAQEFIKTVEGMRGRGAKIQVRIPQKAGTSEANVGSRPSKIVTVNITKRGNAPSTKVVLNSMTVNTTDKMEYKVVSVDGVRQDDAKWAECEKKMALSDMAPQVLTVSGGSVGKNVIVAIRKSETEKAPYSKSDYLTIPAQDKAPDASKFSTSKTSSKFSLIIGDAGKYNQYQYAVVVIGEKVTDSDLAWRTISNTKEINFNSKKYPAGSTIYVRKKGENRSKKVDLKLPSAYTTISISYLTEAKE